MEKSQHKNRKYKKNTVSEMRILPDEFDSRLKSLYTWKFIPLKAVLIEIIQSEEQREKYFLIEQNKTLLKEDDKKLSKCKGISRSKDLI